MDRYYLNANACLYTVILRDYKRSRFFIMGEVDRPHGEGMNDSFMSILSDLGGQ